MKAFTISKGFFLKSGPAYLIPNKVLFRFENITSAIEQGTAQDAKELQEKIFQAEQSVAEPFISNPLLERAFLENFAEVSSEYLRSATSRAQYQVVDSLIAFIPIFGAFYAAKRLNNPDFGPVADIKMRQTMIYSELQACAYQVSTEKADPRENLNSMMLNGCHEFESRDKRVSMMREMLDSIFISSFLVKNKRLMTKNCLSMPYAMDNDFTNKIQKSVFQKFLDHDLQDNSSWIYTMAAYTTIENLYCVERP